MNTISFENLQFLEELKLQVDKSYFIAVEAIGVGLIDRFDDEASKRFIDVIDKHPTMISVKSYIKILQNVIKVFEEGYKKENFTDKELEKIKENYHKKSLSRGKIIEADDYYFIEGSCIPFQTSIINSMYLIDKTAVCFIKNGKRCFKKESLVLSLLLQCGFIVENDLLNKAYSNEQSAFLTDLDNKLGSYTLPDTKEISLMAHQKRNFNFFCKNKKVLIADEQGLGKTISGLTAAKKTLETIGGKALFVVPASKINDWIDEATLLGILRESYDICSYDALNGDNHSYFDTIYSIAVLDECQYIKNVNSARSKNINKIRARTKIGLSGTPAPNKLEELYAILNWLRPDKFTDEMDFKSKYTKAPSTITRFFGKDVFFRKLKQELQNDILVMHNKDNELDLADKIHHILPFENSFQRKQNYEDVYVNLQLEIIEEKLEKLKPLLHKLRDKKLIIFTKYNKSQEILKTFYEELGEKVLNLTGSMTKNKRSACLEEFESNPDCRILLANLIVGGVGLNLQFCDSILFFDLDWVPANILQAEDRIHRMGQKSENIQIYLPYMRQTIDERMLARIIAKTRELSLVFNFNLDVKL